MGVGRPRQQSAQRRNVDDPAAALAFHDRRGGLAAEELGFQIRVQDAVPLLFGELLEVGSKKHSSVVNQNIEAFEFGFGSGE